MHRSLRLDFIEHPAGTGYMVALNGLPIGDRFGQVGEVLAFARALGTPAHYSGTDPSRVVAEGGRLQAGDEGFVR
jgi:hypothetical protein